MSAILNVLRELIARITGVLLVLFETIVPVVDAVPARAYPMHEAIHASRPVRAFRHHPPQAGPLRDPRVRHEPVAIMEKLQCPILSSTPTPPGWSTRISR